MFELPNAKRVKRSELFSTLSSSEEEPDDTTTKARPKARISEEGLRKPARSESASTASASDAFDNENANFEVDYGFEYDFIDVAAVNKDESTNTKNQNTQPQDENTDPADITASPKPHSEQTYAFNLFAPSKSPNPTSTQHPHPTHKPNLITIRSPTPETTLTADPSSINGCITKPRPKSHYFTSALPASTFTTLQHQYASATISGPSILAASLSTPWPGTCLPWRIISIPASNLILRNPTFQPSSTTTTGNNQSKPKPNSRPRPSKKRRIAHRQLLAARETAKQASAQAEEAKREKRTRRNREKKVKRKMREKAKKEESKALTGNDAGLERGGGSKNGSGSESESEDGMEM